MVSTPLKNISQLGWLFPIYGKIKNVPNHQPDKSGNLVKGNTPIGRLINLDHHSPHQNYTTCLVYILHFQTHPTSISPILCPQKNPEKKKKCHKLEGHPSCSAPCRLLLAPRRGFVPIAVAPTKLPLLPTWERLVSRHGTCSTCTVYILWLVHLPVNYSNVNMSVVIH